MKSPLWMPPGGLTLTVLWAPLALSCVRPMNVIDEPGAGVWACTIIGDVATKKNKNQISSQCFLIKELSK